MPINWQKVLSDGKLLSFMERLVEKGVENILPSVNQNGNITYPIMGDLPAAEAVKLLDTLAAEGVFERKSDARLLGCPTHEDSLDLAVMLKCPHCSSTLIKKGTMFQHNCGFIGNQEVFAENCPKCGKPSPAQTLKLMGMWYECEGCKQRFAAPGIFLYCRKFDHDFPVQNARLVDKPSYKLAAEAKKDLKESLALVISLKRAIEEDGGTVEIFGSIAGASGVQHSFDLVINRDGTKIPVDVKLATDAPLGVAGVLATYAKALDTKSKPAVLIAVPHASEDAMKSAAAYGMLIVEGSDAKAILTHLKQALGGKSESPQLLKQ